MTFGVVSASWRDPLRDWDAAAAKLRRLGVHSYLLTISWPPKAERKLSEDLKKVSEAVESLMRHGLEPVIALDFTTCQEQSVRQELLELLKLFPSINRWVTLLEPWRQLFPDISPGVKRRWRGGEANGFKRAVAGHQAAQQIFQENPKAACDLGVLLAIDWLEPCRCETCEKVVEHLQRVSDEIMQRQVAEVASVISSSTSSDSETRSKSGERCIMILPRHCGQVHLAESVEILPMHLDMIASAELAAWFQQAFKVPAEIHIVAAATPLSQILRGMPEGQRQLTQPFSGFWIKEEDALRCENGSWGHWIHKLFKSTEELPMHMNKLKSCDVFSFLVSLSSVEFLPRSLPVLKKAKAIAFKPQDLSLGPSAGDLARQAKWDRTLTAAVNLRRKRLGEPPKSQSERAESLKVCDLAAQIFLSWRRKMRSNQEVHWHVPTIHACLEAVLVLGPKGQWCENACRAVKNSKESLSKSLPPLLPTPSPKADVRDTDIEAAALAAMCMVWSKLQIAGREKVQSRLFHMT